MSRMNQFLSWLKRTGYYRYLPLKFFKHYVMPYTVRKEQKAYDAEQFFDSWYSTLGESGFSDRGTISSKASLLDSQYHYNVAENSLIAWFKWWEVPRPLRVLDIGSGAGHWIDFYLQVLEASHVTGIDIAPPAVEALRTKYAGDDRVTILQGDVSQEGFQATEVDIINAIGVIFHIVDDKQWEQALKNFAEMLSDQGVVVVGGQFGWLTRNVQFHYSDDFDEWNPHSNSARSEVALVNKRIRSLRHWKQASRRCGLKVEKVIKTQSMGGVLMPENNILVLTKRT